MKNVMYENVVLLVNLGKRVLKTSCSRSFCLYHCEGNQQKKTLSDTKLCLSVVLDSDEEYSVGDRFSNIVGISSVSKSQIEIIFVEAVVNQRKTVQTAIR